MEKIDGKVSATIPQVDPEEADIQPLSMKNLGGDEGIRTQKQR